MSPSRTTHRVRGGAGATPSEQLLSVRLEQAILHLRDVERQLQQATAEVLSLQHAVTLIEYTNGDRGKRMKTANLPSNGQHARTPR